jgi:uncharacterized protein DUF3108
MFDHLRGSFRSRKSDSGRSATRTIRAVSFFVLALSTAPVVAPITGCRNNASFDAATAGTFFPLHRGSSWTYRIVDKNLATNQIVTDRALGAGHIDTLKAAGEAVSESANMNSGGSESTFLYVIEDGYLTRVSSVGVPVWASYERRFLPKYLKPGLTWSNSVFPFGRFRGAFYIKQTHRTFLEAGDVAVPAGRFSGCIRIETDAVYQPPRKDGVLHLKYVDWYAPNVGLVKTQVLKSGWFAHPEVARLELLTFADPSAVGATRLSNAASAPNRVVQKESLH